MCVRLANQIQGFRHPARSDAWEKNKKIYPPSRQAVFEAEALRELANLITICKLWHIFTLMFKQLETGCKSLLFAVSVFLLHFHRLLPNTYQQCQQSTASNCPSKAALSKYYPYSSLHSGYPGHQWHHQRLSLPPCRLFLNLSGSHNEIQSSLRPSPGGWGSCMEDLCLPLQL